MNKPYKKSLFVFRRDLRLDDNNGLIKALSLSETVIPCFIFDPRQTEPTNEYRSMNALQYMTESLEELNKSLAERGGKLHLFHGLAEKVIEKLIATQAINALFINYDYTPFSIQRDQAIQKICVHYQCAFEPSHDVLLNPPELIMTSTNTPYTRFTPFYKKSLSLSIAPPQNNRYDNYHRSTIPWAESTTIYKKIVPLKNHVLAIHGGTSPALDILQALSNFKKYSEERDFPAIPTTQLSAPLKFGTISIRHVYYAIKNKLGADHPLIRQLYWRDFYTYIAYHSPFVFGHAYHQKYDALWWKNDKNDFNRWCAGQTGFPLVDAGMRQLNASGFMHNRVRMVVASFLTKDLHIDWQWGERYFAQQLVDYDPAVNNGNWQWTASTGCDAQPYFRVFNPWLQQKKFDPDCVYIKQWIPELNHLDPKTIHSWYSPKHPPLAKYPKPMVDHARQSIIAKKVFKSLG